MGNKWEELEACIQLQGYDLIGVTEIRWDSSQDWSAAMDGYRHRLFKKDKLRRNCHPLCKKELECMEVSKEQVRSQSRASESRLGDGVPL